MPRYKAIIEYDGTRFCGWQRQICDGSIRLSSKPESEPDNLGALGCRPSVQGALEKVIEKITSCHVLVEGAGRTDAGVHATNQVAHFDLPSLVKPEKLQLGINFYLQHFGAVIVSLEETAPDFHARFSAKTRQYEYHIINRKAPLAVQKNRAWHIAIPLDIGAMQKAANYFVGCHNFDSFRAAECQSQNPVRTIDSFEISSFGEKIIGRVQARSFLHRQVRIMIGTLALIGKGKMPPEIIPEILEAKNRSAAGPTAPAYGLYLTGVSYTCE
jgi:tRNA pseudouridine38-40 synthase